MKKTVKYSLKRRAEERRRLLRSIALTISVLGAALLGLLPLGRFSRMRPPGALTEKDFLAACIKCGQCVQVCPVHAIKLALVDEGVGSGVPYLDVRAQACDFSCDNVACVRTCPTGALNHAVTRKEQTVMGIARLRHPDKCLARQGLPVHGAAREAGFRGLLRYENSIQPVVKKHYDLDVCDLCVRHCPIENAIRMLPLSPQLPRYFSPVVQQTCTGCGVCEMLCPSEPAAIAVDIIVERSYT